MKTNLLRTVIVFVICVLTLGFLQVAGAATVNGVNVADGYVGAVYDYSDFAKCGQASSMYSPSNDQTTIIRGGIRTSGYYGSNGDFITTSIVYTYDNGNTSAVTDVLAQKFMNFNQDGSISSAYYKLTFADGTSKTYTADIHDIASGEYAGGYTITWGDASMGEGFPYTETYDSKNQLMMESSDQSKTIYTRDANGEVTQTVKMFTDESPMVTSTFKYGMFAGNSSAIGQTTANTLGKKLLSVNSTNAVGETMVTYYDAHGRVSNGVNFDKSTFENVYNDVNSVTPESFSYYETDVNGNSTGVQKTIAVNVAAGGLLYSKTTKDSGESYITLYHMGCSDYNAGGFYDYSGNY